MNHTKKIEKDVLSTYKKHNPSTHLIEQQEIFKYHQDFRVSLFRDKLKFPLQMFNGAELLDFGSGTGEQDIFYAMWGAKVTGVEMNDLSIKRCLELFKWRKLKIKLHNCSLFDVKLKQKFDIVVSNGVLHHTNEQERGFKKLISYLKPGGFVFISLGNNAGAFQRNLQRVILYKLAKTKKEISDLAKILFKNHLDRAVKYGKRDIESVIYDSYVVPKADNASVKEVMTWFKDNKVKFYSTWPPLQFPFALVDSPRNHILDYTDEKYRDLLSFSEYYWMKANETDKEVVEKNREILHKINDINKIADVIKNVEPKTKINLDKLKFNPNIKNLDTDYRSFLKELSGLVDTLKKTSDVKIIKKQIDKSKILFKGYCGQGEIYYMGYKEK